MKEKTIECIRKFTEDRDRDQFHSPVVRAFGDYGNTTNEGMQMSRCRSADFNGSSNRSIGYSQSAFATCS